MCCDDLISYVHGIQSWRTLVILRIHVRFSRRIPAIHTTVAFVRLQVSLEQGEVRTSIVAQGARIGTNAFVSVNVIPFERPQVTLEHGEVRASIVGHGYGRTILCVLILEM